MTEVEVWGVAAAELPLLPWALATQHGATLAYLPTTLATQLATIKLFVQNTQLESFPSL